ncbi:GAF domain-containing protein, partial [bacterium]
MLTTLTQRESERLKVLRDYHILDTPSEIAFERLTSLSARIFDVPICFVSLIDADRQWFKSCFGIDIRETNRALSFCTHTILSDEVFVVPDATLDPRFAENVFVTGEPYIRFYAGAPLTSPEGLKIGTLSILDMEPRVFDAKLQHMLSDLAASVMDDLELRRTAFRLRENEISLRENE